VRQRLQNIFAENIKLLRAKIFCVDLLYIFFVAILYNEL